MIDVAMDRPDSDRFQRHIDITCKKKVCKSGNLAILNQG